MELRIPSFPSVRCEGCSEFKLSNSLFFDIECSNAVLLSNAQSAVSLSSIIQNNTFREIVSYSEGGAIRA